MAYIYNLADRNRAREELGLQNKFVLGNVGRLSYEKNQKFAMDVLRSILSKSPNKDVALLIVGGGSYERELKEYAIERQIEDKVVFAGMRKDIPQLLSAMDYFVFPSRFEGFGITLLEAQANGVDCLCFDNMPEEIKATDRLSSLPVESSCDEWADIILATKERHNRESYVEVLKNKGFDIIGQAANLKDIYSKIVK